MIVSMTGFGEAHLEADGHAFHVEIRSVNNRYLKTTIRVPDDFSYMEPPLESLLRARLTRGSVTFRVSVRDLSADAAQDLNLAAVEHYLRQLSAVATRAANPVIDLATLAMLPGVCQPQDLSDEQRAAHWTIVERLAGTAIDALMAMRNVEGQALAADLRRNCATVSENLKGIRVLAPRVAVNYREKLLARIRELIANSGVELSEDDVRKEVAIYAERCDVSEELSRLASHLEQFEAGVSSDEPAGRKMDFIAQEMLREANTIGSKASDADISRHVIEIKAAIDRIKEQVQNVE